MMSIDAHSPPVRSSSSTTEVCHPNVIPSERQNGGTPGNSKQLSVFGIPFARKFKDLCHFFDAWVNSLLSHYSFQPETSSKHHLGKESSLTDLGTSWSSEYLSVCSLRWPGLKNCLSFCSRGEDA